MHLVKEKENMIMWRSTRAHIRDSPTITVNCCFRTILWAQTFGFLIKSWSLFDFREKCTKGNTWSRTSAVWIHGLQIMDTSSIADHDTISFLQLNTHPLIETLETLGEPDISRGMRLIFPLLGWILTQSFV